MGSNSTGEAGNHVINICEVNKDRLASLQTKIAETPRLLSKSAGRSTCCIFRVPQSMIDINGRSYQPQIVSIGPYHHGEQRLEMIEEHKWRFLGDLINRTQSRGGLVLEDYLKVVQPLEMKARAYYSESISLNADEFIDMLVVDGCFIIELFRKFVGVVPVEPDDPLISMSWVYSFFLRDLIRLENQIPFFVLQCLFDLTKMPGEESGPSLATLALNFFNNALQRPEEVLAKFNTLEGNHLLDLVRASYIPVEPDYQRSCNNSQTRVIHSISKLRRAGIKLKPSKDDSLLVVRFTHGAIEMPTLTIDDFMSAFLVNCVAYEQCHSSCSKHMTTYATLMDCLVNSFKDVEYLCDRNIIENYFGTDAEVARFINDLGKDVTFDAETCYLAGLFDDVNKYYRNGCHVQWASFRYTYFDTPWSFISVLAACVLLLLTLTQTFFSIIAYVRPRS